MPYFASLYNQRTKTWTQREFKTITACRKACYENIQNTDAYNIPITKSRTGRTVIGEVHTMYGYNGILYSCYVQPGHGLFYLGRDGVKGRMITTNDNYKRKLRLAD